MKGFLLGLICGSVELLLLRRFVNGITRAEKTPIVILLLKIVVMGAFLMVCAIYMPDELLWAGSGIALVLLSGSIGEFGYKLYRNKIASKVEGEETDV